MDIKIPVEILPDTSFACGPSQGHPVARNAKLSDTFFERSHRAADLTEKGLYKEATENLRSVLKIPADYTIFFCHGGATTAMDAIIWNMTLDSISGMVLGAFSKMWNKSMVDVLGDSVKKTILSPKEGSYLPEGELDYNASLLLLTPNETSTGIMLPDSFLEAAWAKKGENTLVAWDCTSCAGGRNLPEAKYDIMVFSLQKCFGAAGGTSVVVLSPKAVARMEEAAKLRKIPYILNLKECVAKAAKYQTLNTPSTTNIWLLNETCKWIKEKGGLEATDALCREHAKIIFDFAAKTNYLEPLIADENYRSYMTATLKITDAAIVDSELNAAVKKSGKANLKDGIGKYSSVKDNALRIACFPFVDPDGVTQFEKLTKTIDYIVTQMRTAK